MSIRLTGVVLIGGVMAGGIQLGRYTAQQMRSRAETNITAPLIEPQEEVLMPVPGLIVPEGLSPRISLSRDGDLFRIRRARRLDPTDVPFPESLQSGNPHSSNSVVPGKPPAF